MRPVALPELPGRTRPYLMAHRGNRVRCPENTMAAFRQALQDGADILETDLRLSADGFFMCIHDASVDRTTDGTGEVQAMTLKDLKALDASHGKPAYQNERIPALEELIHILPQDVALALELKSDDFLDAFACSRLMGTLDQAGVKERTILLSFSMARLQAVASVDDSILRGWITLRRAWPLPGVSFLGPFWPLLLLNPLYPWLAHRQGQMVCPLDPMPDKRLGFFRWIGCDAFLSDDPASTRLALDAILGDRKG